jgi:pyoverdine/dityrosine biosynthesis protein Dit1
MKILARQLKYPNFKIRFLPKNVKNSFFAKKLNLIQNFLTSK